MAASFALVSGEGFETCSPARWEDGSFSFDGGGDTASVFVSAVVLLLSPFNVSSLCGGGRSAYKSDEVDDVVGF